MVIKTVERDPLFTINGTSVLSAGAYSLAGEVDDLKDKGVGALRISPQSKDTGRVVEVFRARIDSTLGASEATAELKALSPEGISNGWYHGLAGRAGLAGQAGRAGKDLLSFMNA
jgi:collagenase-like PrtC family protease